MPVRHPIELLYSSFEGLKAGEQHMRTRTKLGMAIGAVALLGVAVAQPAKAAIVKKHTLNFMAAESVVN